MNNSAIAMALETRKAGPTLLKKRNGITTGNVDRKTIRKTPTAPSQSFLLSRARSGGLGSCFSRWWIISKFRRLQDGRDQWRQRVRDLAVGLFRIGGLVHRLERRSAFPFSAELPIRYSTASMMPQARLHPMAIAHRVEIELSGPYGDERIEQTVWSGSYLAVAVGAQRTVLRPDDGTEPHDTEHLAARLLSRIALGYSAHWDDAERELAGLLDTAVVRPLPALAIAGNAIDVTTLFGLPQALEWRGVTLDAALRVAEPIGRPADPAAALDWMRLSALTGSALEHVVFETDFLTDAISADKGLGLARQQGIEIVRVDAANADTVVSGLALPAAVQAEIANAARLGLIVEVPRTELQRNAWRGAVWRVEDEETARPATSSPAVSPAARPPKSRTTGSSASSPKPWQRRTRRSRTPIRCRRLRCVSWSLPTARKAP